MLDKVVSLFRMLFSNPNMMLDVTCLNMKYAIGLQYRMFCTFTITVLMRSTNAFVLWWTYIEAEEQGTAFYRRNRECCCWRWGYRQQTWVGRGRTCNKGPHLQLNRKPCSYMLYVSTTGLWPFWLFTIITAVVEINADLRKTTYDIFGPARLSLGNLVSESDRKYLFIYVCTNECIYFYSAHSSVAL